MSGRKDVPPKDIRMVVGFKNNLILSAMEKMGYKNVAELSRDCGIDQARLGYMVNMKELPVTKDGSWRSTALRLAVFFKCHPEDLFSEFQSEFQQEHKLEENRTYAEMHFGEIQAMLAFQSSELLEPSVAVERLELSATIEETIDRLEPKLQRVLRGRFGIGGPEMTDAEIAKEIGTHRAYVGELLKRALKLLRSPGRCALLREASGVE